jgi:radical SAM protein with 4Fe4S-binding SPASM domain
LTGGEPFIRPDFLKIYSHAKKRGLLVTIFSNGTTITPRIADFLAEQPPFAVEITLYGCTEKTYESVTRVPGSFGRCMKGIELLVERDLPLSLKSVALTLNQHELEAMGTYAGGLGLEFRFDPELNMRIDGGKRPALFRLTPEQVVALDIRDRRRRNEWEKSCRDTRRVNGSSDLLYPCGAGVHSFHIDPYGELSICMMVRSATYNLRKGKFVEGWHRFIPEVRSTRRTKKIPCDTCNLTSICSQCPGVAEMETGDPEQVVEYLCRITRLRERVFGSYYTTGERKDDNCSSGLLAKEALQEA